MLFNDLFPMETLARQIAGNLKKNGVEVVVSLSGEGHDVISPDGSRHPLEKIVLGALTFAVAQAAKAPLTQEQESALDFLLKITKFE